MTRTLPWLAQPVKKALPKQASSSSPAPRRKRDDSPDDLVDDDLNSTGVLPREKREKTRQLRSPSTSPPPAPPDVEYMREGYAEDDIWMMVEDEFQSTAQLFTQHIHHAEYVRLKKRAKSRGAGTLQALSRPTDGRTSQSTQSKLKAEGAARDRKTNEGMRDMLGQEDSEEDDDYMKDPQLAGLMTGSQRGAQDLTGMAKAKANTRAAAGFTKSPQKVQRVRQDLVNGKVMQKTSIKQRDQETRRASSSDEDSEDLDRPARRSVGKPPVRAVPAVRQNLSSASASASEGKKRVQSSDIFKQFAEVSQLEGKTAESRAPGAKLRSPKPPRQASAEIKVETESPTTKEETDDEVTSSRKARIEASQFLAKRRAARGNKEQREKPKAGPSVDVPTFLII